MKCNASYIIVNVDVDIVLKRDIHFVCIFKRISKLRYFKITHKNRIYIYLLFYHWHRQVWFFVVVEWKRKKEVVFVESFHVLELLLKSIQLLFHLFVFYHQTKLIFAVISEDNFCGKSGGHYLQWAQIYVLIQHTI